MDGDRFRDGDWGRLGEAGDIGCGLIRQLLI